MSVKPSFSNIGPGYNFSGARAGALAARTRYIRRYGAAWLFAGEAPPAPGWPAMNEAPNQTWSRAHDTAKSSYLKAAIADHVADGGYLKDAALTLGISKSYASKIWREIVKEMGWQAQ